MTVKELKEKLNAFPDDMQVMVRARPDGNYLSFLADIDDELTTSSEFINVTESSDYGISVSQKYKEVVTIDCDEN